MTTNIEPEELEALMEVAATRGTALATGEAELRNFGNPRRMNATALDKLRSAATDALPGVDRSLRAVFFRSYALDVVDVGEVGCEGLFDDLEGPLCMMRFTAAGQTGWIQWDPAAAVSALEVVLGSDGAGSQPARDLSLVERSILARVLSTVVQAICSGVGVAASNLRPVDTRDQIEGWRDGGENADPGRVFIALGFEGPGDPSHFKLYIPGLTPAGKDERAAVLVEAPPHHLRDVELEARAFLGSVQLPLNEMLRIEVGDVIPLGCPVGAPLRLTVEGELIALGRLGSNRGNLALRIDQLLHRDEE